MPPTFDEFLQAQAAALRENDPLPPSRGAWLERAATLRKQILDAAGPFPESDTPLKVDIRDVLLRDGYRIEKLVLQSRPGVYVTGSAYLPDPLPEGKKLPAVLVVHGHWAWARRDPVVQARCLGLVKLGFFVLAIDAFGAGERYQRPARGTYHGALNAAPLWPTGHTLLGLQIYDNRRAVDYLLTRKEVDGTKLGITGASGGGNQTMYAGALDERLKVVVPVCSVGRYQAYLRAACCLCEVLPGALRFTEEGDVLGLVAPRPLLVISAERDAFQFSPGEAKHSVARAKQIYDLFGAGSRLRHDIVASGHDYNLAMREAMYGFMTLHLKEEGRGDPIPEPAHKVEDPETLTVLPVKDRPAGMLFPPTFAKQVGDALVAEVERLAPTHAQEWEATVVGMQKRLLDLLGSIPKVERPVVRFIDPPGEAPKRRGESTAWFELRGEAGLLLRGCSIVKDGSQGEAPPCLLLTLDGTGATHPAVGPLVKAGWEVIAFEPRATGSARPKNDGVAGAFDHNSAEHALWLGRPLLGQWLTDVLALLTWRAEQPNPRRKTAVVGVGPAGLLALTTSIFAAGTITNTVLLGAPISLRTESPYGVGSSLGILVPGMLRVGDTAHLAAMVAPRRLLIIEGTYPEGGKARLPEVEKAFAFTGRVYAACRAKERLTTAVDLPADRWVDLL